MWVYTIIITQILLYHTPEEKINLTTIRQSFWKKIVREKYIYFVYVSLLVLLQTIKKKSKQMQVTLEMKHWVVCVLFIVSVIGSY